MVASADVVVVGAGCMGLFLADALKQSGRSVIVVDHAYPLRYASIRNLGWLQSGAIEATRRNADAGHVRQFQAGHRALLERFPDAVGTTPGAFLYPRRDQPRASALHNSWSADLQLTMDRTVKDMIATTRRGLDDTSHICVGVQDRVFDSYAILERLSADTFDDLTAGFVGVDDLERLAFEQIPEGWQLALDGRGVCRGRVCVLASGVFSAMFAQRYGWNLGESDGFVRYTVGALTGTLCTGVVTCVQRGGPSLIPQPPDRPSHTLVYFAGSDQPEVSGGLQVTNKDCIDFLANFSMWFDHLAQRPPIPCQLYSCLRFKSVHGVKHKVLDRGLVFSYPSYFTLGPVAADRCAEQILEYLGSSASLPLAGMRGRPTYSRQFFANTPESQLRWVGNRFVLEPFAGDM